MAIQGNVPRPGLDFNAERRRVLDNHVSVTVSGAQRERDAGAPTPDLVVWPENASDIDPTRNPDAAAAITQAVTAVGAPILLGGLLEEPAPQVSNVSLLYRPGAGLVGRYAKQHPVPFAEYIPNRSFWRIFSTQVDLLRTDMWAGPGPVVFRVPAASGGDVVAGPSICFEVAYDDLVRANVDLGANLLVVQTNNATFGFTHESVQQLAISRIRAIEHGRSVAHVSTVGVSALILPDGTLLQPTTLFTPAALVADLPVRLERTLADRLGAWPEYCAVFGMLALLVGTALSRRRRKDLTSP
jgi:apolipoprotein N-acyltransferase